MWIAWFSCRSPPRCSGGGWSCRSWPGSGLCRRALSQRTITQSGVAHRDDGVTHAIREIGGVLGIGVLAAVFSARGGYMTPSAFVDGFVPALTIGAIMVAICAAAALLIPSRQRATATSLKPALGAAS
jgi:hypothetical protein